MKYFFVICMIIATSFALPQYGYDPYGGGYGGGGYGGGGYGGFPSYSGSSASAQGDKKLS